MVCQRRPRGSQVTMWSPLLCAFLLLPSSAPQRQDGGRGGPECPARLSPVGGCGPDQQDCLYRLTLPALTLALPTAHATPSLLEETLQEVRSLKETVRRISASCLEGGRGGTQADQGSVQTGPEERGDGEGPGTGPGPGPGPNKVSAGPNNEQAMQVKLTKMSASLRNARSQITALQGRLDSLKLLNMENIQAMVDHRVENIQAMVDNRVDNLTGLVNKMNSGCHTQCALQSPQFILAPRDCSDYSVLEQRKNGVYRVTPDPRNGTFDVFCDMESYGGGWTVIQHRFNGSVGFNRTWSQYKKGFGKLMGEFWLGNDHIHLLTKAKDMVLRVELEDVDGIREYAKYDHFYVANEFLRYKLSLGGYSGTAGDALMFDRHFNHDQKFFSTPDRDNDMYPSGSCAAYYSAGWWFDACMSANLNGRYYHRRYKGVRNGIFWGTWHNVSSESYPTNYRQAFRTVKMMIRPKNYAP